MRAGDAVSPELTATPAQRRNIDLILPPFQLKTINVVNCPVFIHPLDWGLQLPLSRQNPHENKFVQGGGFVTLDMVCRGFITDGQFYFSQL